MSDKDDTAKIVMSGTSDGVTDVPEAAPPVAPNSPPEVSPAPTPLPPAPSNPEVEPSVSARADSEPQASEDADKEAKKERQRDANKASKLRRLLREGKSLAPTDKDWLDLYSARTKPRGNPILPLPGEPEIPPVRFEVIGGGKTSDPAVETGSPLSLDGAGELLSGFLRSENELNRKADFFSFPEQVMVMMDHAAKRIEETIAREVGKVANQSEVDAVILVGGGSFIVWTGRKRRRAEKVEVIPTVEQSVQQESAPRVDPANGFKVADVSAELDDLGNPIEREAFTYA